MSQIVRVRIVNKAKDGITLKTDNISQKMSWDDFNKNFDLDPNDKFYAIMKQETIDESAKVVELVEQAVLAMFMSRGNNPEAKLVNAMMLGDLTERFQKMVPDSCPGDFLRLVRVMYDKQVNAMLGMGVGFTAEEDNTILNCKQRRQNRRNLKRLEKQKDEDVYTIGDAMKAKAETLQKSAD